MRQTRDVAPTRTKNKKRKTQTPTRVLAAHAIEGALEKKAHDISVLDMRNVSGMADYFVVCTGDSDLQIKAIYDAIESRIEAHCEERPWHKEGEEHRQWVLLDYVDLVVHIFNEDRRAFYDLERLWGDALIERVPDEATSADGVRLLQPTAP